MAFSPDGRRLASSNLGGVIKVWDLDATRPHEPLTLKGHTGSVDSVTFSPDGMQIASASVDGTIKIWDARSEPEAQSFEGHTMAFSPDGNWLASINWEQPVKLWDTTTGQNVRTLGSPTEANRSFALSPDGARLATGRQDGTVKLWDVANGRELRTIAEGGHTGKISNVKFSPDGKWLAWSTCDTVGDVTGHGPAAVKLCDVATGQQRLTLRGHTQYIWSVAFSPDGTRLATTSMDRTVRVWDVATGQPIRTFEGPSFLIQIAFSPDGTLLAMASRGRTIELRDVLTGEPIRNFEGNAAHIRALAFTPDGRRLVSTGHDGTVKLWDVATGQEALALRAHTSAGWSAAFSPDGTRLATGDNSDTAKLWDARPWTPEAAIEREALGLLDSLFAKPLRKADVIEYLQSSPTIRHQALQLALSLVDRYHEESKPEKYQEVSWAIVRQPYLNAVQYRFALFQAEHACRLAPNREGFRDGLGAALYRAGRYREAIETLGKANRLDKGSPAPWRSSPWPITSSGSESRPGPSSLACDRASTSLAGRRTLRPWTSGTKPRR